MNKRKKSKIFIMIVYVATIIVTIVGATFAYFSASVRSKENVVGLVAAEFKVELEDDTSLIKSKLIPSAELYVDRATIERLDENGNFVKPYEENGELIKERTACIDDNMNEICSIYTFTIINPMTTTELPAYVTINPTVNSFSNLYFKVVDENKKVVMEATHIKDDRSFTIDKDGNKVFEKDSKIAPIVLSGINITLPKATKDENTGAIIPTKATYSVIIWVMETGNDQTKDDSNQIFAGTLRIESSGENGGGISGVFSAGGVDNE